MRKVGFDFQMGREYDILIAARGPRLSVHVDGVLVNEHTDVSNSSGGVGLNLWHPTHARFRDLKVRHFR